MRKLNNNRSFYTLLWTGGEGGKGENKVNDYSTSLYLCIPHSTSSFYRVSMLMARVVVTRKFNCESSSVVYTLLNMFNLLIWFFFFRIQFRETNIWGNCLFLRYPLLLLLSFFIGVYSVQYSYTVGIASSYFAN